MIDLVPPLLPPPQARKIPFLYFCKCFESRDSKQTALFRHLCSMMRGIFNPLTLRTGKLCNAVISWISCAFCAIASFDGASQI